MTHEEVEELVARRVAEEMEAREAVINLKPLNENGDEQKGENGENGNGGNGGNRNVANGGNRNEGNGENENGNRNRNRNRNHGMNYGGFMPWNSHKRTIGVDAAYVMKWVGIMKLMTEELILLCTRMVPDEEDIVERFIGGLPDNIQGNVIAMNPARLQDAIRIANQLMDKKLQGYATRSAENKMRIESNPRDNRRQQPPFKRQNISGQNVARAYTAGNNERRGYTGPHPLCNKCRYHYVGPCTVRCGNYKKVGYLTRDYTASVAPNTQRAPVGNQQDKKHSWKQDWKPDWRSFTSSTFSALLDVSPSTLDTSYVVELADGSVSETNFVLRGCTLGLV
nr:hypothetical protein [Tanacetum cinerariifolium]